jgi:hypothetical protein
MLTKQDVDRIVSDIHDNIKQLTNCASNDDVGRIIKAIEHEGHFTEHEQLIISDMAARGCTVDDIVMELLILGIGNKTKAAVLIYLLQHGIKPNYSHE